MCGICYLIKTKFILLIFGEVRKGNNHFDISAVISSCIDWNKSENELITSLIDFRNGYLSNFKAFNWNVLKESLALWFTRGILALFINNGVNEATSNYVELTIRRKTKLDRILKNNFL
ncbi:hypothetical protein J2T56_002285 [Natronobacillus azotifigens]